MKTHLILGLTSLQLAACCAKGQGLLYDQQSSTNEFPFGGNVTIQQLAAPYGQSFTPTFAAIGFIKMQFGDRQPGNGIGATVFINLRTNSVSGPILASTAPIFMLDGFAGIITFFFSSEVPITPGLTYYFQPVVQSGFNNDLWNLNAGPYEYPGGSAFANGLPGLASDYWFREGIVPEPSATTILMIGVGLFLLVGSRFKRGENPDLSRRALR